MTSGAAFLRVLESWVSTGMPDIALPEEFDSEAELEQFTALMNALNIMIKGMMNAVEAARNGLN